MTRRNSSETPAEVEVAEVEVAEVEAAEVEAAEVKAVEVGDVILLDKAANLAVLPDNTVVTCRNTYTVQHEGRHVIGGVEYVATDPRKAEPVEPVEPVEED